MKLADEAGKVGLSPSIGRDPVKCVGSHKPLDGVIQDMALLLMAEMVHFAEMSFCGCPSRMKMKQKHPITHWYFESCFALSLPVPSNLKASKKFTRCGIEAPEVKLAGEAGKVGSSRRGVREQMQTRSSTARAVHKQIHSLL